MTPLRSYDEMFDELGKVLLEESWVTGLDINERVASFMLEAVLLEGHPYWSPPFPGEQFCYRDGLLQIRCDSPMRWELSDLPPARDSSGKLDWGHIDSFKATTGQGWRLDGDWGWLEIMSPRVRFVFRSAASK